MSIVPQVTKKLTMKGNAVEMRALRFATSSHAVLYCLKDSPLRRSAENALMTRMPGSESVSTAVTATHLRQMRR